MAQADYFQQKITKATKNISSDNICEHVHMQLDENGDNNVVLLLWHDVC